jgi:hypothetical protein
MHSVADSSSARRVICGKIVRILALNDPRIWQLSLAHTTMKSGQFHPSSLRNDPLDADNPKKRNFREVETLRPTARKFNISIDTSYRY